MNDLLIYQSLTLEADTLEADYNRQVDQVMAIKNAYQVIQTRHQIEALRLSARYYKEKGLTHVA